MTVPDVERWLVQILEAWRDANRTGDRRALGLPYVQGQAKPQLAPAFAKSHMLTLDHRFYRDLGADLDRLGVVYDIKTRPDKSPWPTPIS